MRFAMAAAITCTERPLYGGAITAELPTAYVRANEGLVSARLPNHGEAAHLHQHLLPNPVTLSSANSACPLLTSLHNSPCSASSLLVLQVDASRLREIPDNQEVWLSPTGDDSIIVELLEHEAVSNEDSAKHFFMDLAEANDAQDNATVEEKHEIDLTSLTGLLSHATAEQLKGAYCCLLIGRQQVAKYKESARNDVRLCLGVIRLPSVETDLLITLNCPVAVNPESSSAAAMAGAGVGEEAGGASLAAPSSVPPDVVLRCLTTLCIRDWGLFGG